MIYRPVENKRDFVPRYARGEFGNAGPTWLSTQDFLNDDEYHIRTQKSQLYHLRNRKPGGTTYYAVSVQDIQDFARTSVTPPTVLRDYYVSAMAPHDYTLLQGEVHRTVAGLSLTATFSKLPMRDALKEDCHSFSGLRAKLLLQKTLCPNSYDWLAHLLDSYDGHIVEFSAFGVNWGTLPRYNTVFWEVRPNRPFGSNPSRFTEVY